MTVVVKREDGLVGRRIEIEGVVQGVGFRPWIYRLARQEGLAGEVRNDDSGVTIEAFGESESIARLLSHLDDDAPPAASIDVVRSRPLALPDGQDFPADFAIVPSVHSATAGRPRMSIPPDVATCDRCLAEVHDPSDRRAGYPFTNCTDCGPRYTIATALPYDRPATTMARFVQCPRCLAEYHDPADRRFHAQPNACPECGPRLKLLGADGLSRDLPDPLAATAAALCDGLIVAIQGLGGFHLACDAGSGSAVRRLRERKQRSTKPFAVMVRDLDAARRLAVLAPDEATWLGRPERPIVLVESATGSGLAEAVAPGNRQVGLFLPYTPLHHLLLEQTGRPLVMTSGNLADQPIAIDPEEAVRRLAGVADLFLANDRPIAARCDDSVIRLHDDGPVLLRRSRGFVPRPLRLAGVRFDRPTLGCGAQLKTAVCLGVEDAAYLGAHIGDLEGVDTYEAYAESIDHLERLLGVRAEVIAHDCHPDFLSTRWARERAATETGVARVVERVAVPHHHAHLAAVLAEHPGVEHALAVTWDGFGLGSDGGAWGGEILVGDAACSRRVATLRPIALAGGDVAVREVWRLALALVMDAFDGEPPLDALPLFGAVDRPRLEVVRQMLARDVQVTPAHGAGRLFDAVGALVLALPLSHHEAEIAIALEQTASPQRFAPYPFALDHRSTPWLIDHRPMTRAIVDDLRAGVAAEVVAARFHDTLVEALAQVLARAAAIESVRTIALTGGCLVNRRLADPLRTRLEPKFRTIRPHHAPPGDGGISLGQVFATACARSRGIGEPSCV